MHARMLQKLSSAVFLYHSYAPFNSRQGCGHCYHGASEEIQFCHFRAAAFTVAFEQ
jgi:hypothetical protein